MKLSSALRVIGYLRGRGDRNERGLGRQIGGRSSSMVLGESLWCCNPTPVGDPELGRRSRRRYEEFTTFDVEVTPSSWVERWIQDGHLLRREIERGSSNSGRGDGDSGPSNRNRGDGDPGPSRRPDTVPEETEIRPEIELQPSAEVLVLSDNRWTKDTDLEGARQEVWRKVLLLPEQFWYLNAFFQG